MSGHFLRPLNMLNKFSKTPNMLTSSNVLHSRALLQKSATGCLVHHYSYPSDQFVENNTLDQIDVTK